MMIPESHPSGSLPELARRQVEPARWREALHTTLLAWYREHGRALPWRETRDPYRIWLSEGMLQQTQVERAIPYYHRFLQRFPDLAALAAAHEDEVLKAWEGLGFSRLARRCPGRAAPADAPADEVVKGWEGRGFSRRARLFHQAARELLGAGGQVPAAPARFRRLPGVGAHPAGAVLSLAFGVPLPAV